MSDPLRTGSQRPADREWGVERDARIEQLLLEGLDRYFNREYERAIHIWTRVLFLDRGHARARAYIERARSAQAERQRESEELLHRGVAAFDRGETGDARQLLTAAVSQGAAPEVALSYLGRLDRLEAPSASPAAVDVRPADGIPPPGAPRARRWPRVTAAVVASLAAAAGVSWAVVVLLELADLRGALQLTRAPAAALAPVREPLVVPRPADVALARARAVFATGHVAEAQRMLSAIGPGDPLEPEADRLRAEIQRMLLASIPPEQPPASSTVVHRR